MEYASHRAGYSAWRADLDIDHEMDVQTLLTQLTAAAWYLDRAVATDDAGARDRDIQQARRIHDQVGAWVRRKALSDPRHRPWEEPLGVLKRRLEGFGEQF